MVTILNQKWPPKYKHHPIWAKFGFQVDYDVANWYPSFGSHVMILKIISYLVISCYVLTLFFIHTTSTCIVRLGDICNALRYCNQHFPLWIYTFCIIIMRQRWLSGDCRRPGWIHTLVSTTTGKLSLANSLLLFDWLVFSVNFSNISALSVICVVFLWSVSIDQAYLNVLVVISKLLGQSILGMRQLPRMNILVLIKDWLRHQNQ